jgi:hypothetical protein
MTAGAFGFFDFHPMRRTTGTVGRAEPFRHDTFAAELASVLEHDIAVAVVVLIEDDTRMRGANEPRQLVLAVLYWSAA